MLLTASCDIRVTLARFFFHTTFSVTETQSSGVSLA